MKAQHIIDYLTKARFDRLMAQTDGRARDCLDELARSDRDVPTCAVWLLQKCGSKPSNLDLERWAKDVSALTAAPKPKRGGKAKP